MPITSKDLSQLLGVSTATVSLLINDKPGLSKELRQRLITQINQLGYGDMLATAEQRTPPFIRAANCGKKTVAYIIYPPADENENEEYPFFPPILEGAEIEARARGYNLQIIHIAKGQEQSLRSLLHINTLMGLIVQPDSVTDTVIATLEDLGLPYVLVNRPNCGPHGAAICINNGEGLFCAVDHLKSKGHRQIGYVYSGRSNVCFAERMHCYKIAIGWYQLPETCGGIFLSGNKSQLAITTLADQMQAHIATYGSFPTALVAENDFVAWHTMEAARRIGLRVPEDLSVIGFDDTSVASMTEPPLTTLRVPRRFWGRQLVVTLDSLWRFMQENAETAPMRLNMGVRLIERGSVAPPRCTN